MQGLNKLLLDNLVNTDSQPVTPVENGTKHEGVTNRKRSTGSDGWPGSSSPVSSPVKKPRSSYSCANCAKSFSCPTKLTKRHTEVCSQFQMQTPPPMPALNSLLLSTLLNGHCQPVPPTPNVTKPPSGSKQKARGGTASDSALKIPQEFPVKKPRSSHPCPYCHKSFPCPSKLSRHQGGKMGCRMFTVTGLPKGQTKAQPKPQNNTKPFPCHKCAKTFVQQTTLTCHMLRVHGN